jgi:hypothetical protein
VHEEKLERAQTEQCEIEECKLRFAESEACATRLQSAAKRRSAAERSFFEAADFARNQMKLDGLEGEVRPHYEIRYTVAQGLKAAIHGREDTAAALVLQRDILVRLDAIKSLLWVAIGVLVFIAYKLA